MKRKANHTTSNGYKKSHFMLTMQIITIQSDIRDRCFHTSCQRIDARTASGERNEKKRGKRFRKSLSLHYFLLHGRSVLVHTGTRENGKRQISLNQRPSPLWLLFIGAAV